jgi:hypothetical protein
MIFFTSCKPIVSNNGPARNGLKADVIKIADKIWEIKLNYPLQQNSVLISVSFENESGNFTLSSNGNNSEIKWLMNEERWRSHKPFILLVKSTDAEEKITLTVQEGVGPVIDTVLRAALWAVR